jgi:hypothetical protein
MMRSRARPAAEQRALDRIENTLLEADRPLRTMYAIFAAMNQFEAMPATERIAARQRRMIRRPRLPALPRLPVLLRAAVVTALALAVIILGLLAARPQPCPGTSGAVAAHAQAQRAVRPSVCPARPPG